jgi:hypothetical protein
MLQKGKDDMFDGALEIIARELNHEGVYLHRFDRVEELLPNVPIQKGACANRQYRLPFLCK